MQENKKKIISIQEKFDNIVGDLKYYDQNYIPDFIDALNLLNNGHDFETKYR